MASIWEPPPSIWVLPPATNNKHTRRSGLTGAVAHATVADDVVAAQDAQSFDLLGEIGQEGALAGLELLHGQQLARVVPQGVVATQLHAAKVPLGAGERNVKVAGLI